MTTSPTLETAQPLPRPTAPARPHTLKGFDLRAILALYVLSIRQNLHGRKWMILAVLFLLPAALVACIRATAPNPSLRGLEFAFAFMFIPQGLLPLVALLYASGMLMDEQEEQTITYLLIRPISRWAIYLTKLLATLTTAVTLTALFTALVYVALYFRSGVHDENIPLRCLKAVLIHSLAVVAYCCLFGLISLFTRRALIVGILYAAIIEGLLANLPLSIRLITVIYYTRIIAYRTLSFVLHFPGNTMDIAASAWWLDVEADPLLKEHPQINSCILTLLIASAVCALLAAFLCSRREFHVKTPEKS